MDNRIRMIIRCHARHQAMLGRFKEMMEMARPEPPKPDDEAAILELHEIIAGMSLVQQEVCQSLMHGDNMHAIANDMDRAWNSIKHHVQCIREIFTDKGFDQWFE
jgi:DNA-binding NarL/FixJ family response regulator